MVINEERIVNRFLDYVKISSETGNELEFAIYLKQELESIGFTVDFDNAGDAFGGNCGNLIAKLPGTIKGKPLLFSGHMDTVSPGKNIKPIIKDGIIYSDGTTILGGDDKAGIAIIVEGILTVIENKSPHTDIELLFTVAEEGGLHGSRNLDLSLIKAKEGFIFDSSRLPGEIITDSPALSKINVTINGKAAHAGVCPENGINAAQVFAEAVSNMKLLRIDDETTANIGSVKGGTATNIVLPELVITAEVRSLSIEKLNNQVEHMRSCFEDACEKYDTSFEFKSDQKYDAFHVEDESNVVKKVLKAYSAIGIDAYTTFTGGASDANVLNGRGIEIINLGIGEKQAHTLNEHYYIKDLLLMSKFITSLINVHNNY